MIEWMMVPLTAAMAGGVRQVERAHGGAGLLGIVSALALLCSAWHAEMRWLAAGAAATALASAVLTLRCVVVARPARRLWPVLLATALGVIAAAQLRAGVAWPVVALALAPLACELLCAQISGQRASLLLVTARLAQLLARPLNLGAARGDRRAAREAPVAAAFWMYLWFTVMPMSLWPDFGLLPAWLLCLATAAVAAGWVARREAVHSSPEAAAPGDAAIAFKPQPLDAGQPR